MGNRHGRRFWRVAPLTPLSIAILCLYRNRSALSLGAVTDFSDGMLLAMCFPNLIGVYLLLPVVKQIN